MGQWVHKMMSVDIDTLTGVCANCGEVSIKRKKNASGGYRYLCGPSQKRWPGTPESKARRARKYHREHRTPYRASLADECQRCGFVPVDSCQLDVHHRDRDHENNHPGNLVTLCANCHRLEHMAQAA